MFVHAVCNGICAWCVCLLCMPTVQAYACVRILSCMCVCPIVYVCACCVCMVCVPTVQAYTCVRVLLCMCVHGVGTPDVCVCGMCSWYVCMVCVCLVCVPRVHVCTHVCAYYIYMYIRLVLAVVLIKCKISQRLHCLKLLVTIIIRVLHSIY